jgi:outer membrane receptor protein involved in Fe transport
MKFAATRKAALLAASAMLSVFSYAHADENRQPDAGLQSETSEVVIVTAQKRSQKITEVPISISAYNNKFLNQIGATELSKVAQITPGLVIELQDRLLPGISVRGITSDDTSPASEPRVAIFQDGVPITQIASAYAEMFDVERIEVERGPQSTLHGRSALNGGISVFQKMPSDTFGTEFKAGVGDHNYTLLQGVINVPVNDVFGVRFGALLHKQDGFVKDTQSENTYNNINSQAYRLTAKFIPNDAFSFKFSGTYDYDDTNSGGAFRSSVFLPLDQQTGVAQGTLDFWSPTHLSTFGTLPSAYSKRKVVGLSGTSNYKLNEKMDLTGISGYRWYEACQAGDIDGTPTNIIAYEQCNGGEQYSQELRLNFKNIGKFDGFVGASYFTAKNNLTIDLASDERAVALLMKGILHKYAPTGLTNNQINALLGSAASVYKSSHIDRKLQTADIETYDIFADGTYHITDKLEAFVGGRVTWDEKQVSLQVTTPQGVSKLTGKGLLMTMTPGGALITGEHSSSVTTGRAGLRYVINPNVNVYAVYGIGKRPEMIEILSSGAADIIPSEELKSAETGIKFRLFKGALVGDASVYHYDYANFQTKQRNEGVLVTVNAGDASATGFETQANWRITKYLSAFGSYAYNNARFNSGAYKDNHFRNSPDNKYSIGFNLSKTLPAGEISFAPVYSWQSKIYFSDDNDRADLQVRSPAAFSDNKVDEFQKDYGLLSAKLNFVSASEIWSVSLVGDNLLDEKYMVDAGNTGDVFGMPTFIAGPGQTVRLEFNIKM